MAFHRRRIFPSRTATIFTKRHSRPYNPLLPTGTHRTLFQKFQSRTGQYHAPLSTGKKRHPPYFSRRDFITLNFMKLVSKHFAKEHHIEFYADSLCISIKHLTRVIKEMIGKTPHTVICDEITHQAMTLLEDDSISIGEIAETLHFSDQASFCKFFKKQKKISPMAYRRQNKMNIS